MCGSRFGLKFQMNHKSNSLLTSHVYLVSVLFNAEKTEDRNTGKMWIELNGTELYLFRMLRFSCPESRHRIFFQAWL